MTADTMPGSKPGAPLRRSAICVFCGSSHGSDAAYTEAARRFGALMVKEGFDLVFGGGGVGLMGEVAASVSREGGHVLGIIPSFLRHLEPPLNIESQIVVTENLNERKARMFDAADGFAVLPGGIGTLDEFAEAFTAAQLHLHAKPIVLINVKGFFTPMLALLEHIVTEGFAKPTVMDLIRVVLTPEEAIQIFSAQRGHS